MRGFFFVYFSVFMCSLSQATVVSVDTLIVVAVDVSGSITDEEYVIQKEGVIAAFRDPQVQKLLDQCSIKGIGVTYVEWSGARNGQYVDQVIPWTQLLTPQDMEIFSQQLSEKPRSSRGETDIVNALRISHQLLMQAPFESDNKIISLSTDGRQSFTIQGIDVEIYVQNTRNQIANDNIMINAIAIEKETLEPSANSSTVPVVSNPFGVSEESIMDYLQRNVITGPNSLLTPVSNFKSYSDVFKKQISVMLNGCIS